MSVISNIYSELSLDNFTSSKPHLEKYCQSMKSYKQNKYQWETSTLDKIKKDWAFALKQWNYNEP